MKRTLVQEIRFEQDYRTLKAVQRDRLRQIAAATMATRCRRAS
jgi:hypothetical protein